MNSTMSEFQQEYWAFISYRHHDNQTAGREWATWIAREIETYEVPADLVGTPTERGEIVPERLYPVFRDEDELSAGDDLNSPIYQALRNSKSLVVICSPRAVDSRYVANEINFFKSLDRPRGVLAMMIEGEPHAGDGRECFPKQLKHPVSPDGNLDTTRIVEPIAADFRLPDGHQGWHSLEECRNHLADEASVTRYRERCELAKLKIIAGILGLPLSKLAERDKAYQLALAQKRARIITQVALAMALLAICAIVAGIFAWQKREQAIAAQAVAEKTRDAAEDLVEDIIFNLRDKLEPIGRLDLLDDSTQAAENYFARLPASMVTEESEHRRSAVLDTRAQILEHTGELDSALKTHRDSLAISRELARKEPTDPKRQLNVALSLREISDVLIAQNLPHEARPLLDEAQQMIDSVLDAILEGGAAETFLNSLKGDRGDQPKHDAIATIEQNPGLADVFANSAVIAERLGNIAHLTGDRPTAVEYYRKSLLVQQALAVAQPDTDHWRRGQASSHDKIGNVHLMGQDFEAARSEFQKLTEITEREISEQPDNAYWQDLHAGGLDRLATIDLGQDKSDAALKKLRRAMTIWQELSAADPTNLTRLRHHYVGLHKLGLALKAAGKPADNTFAQARRIVRRLVDADPSNAVWRRDLAFSLDNLANVHRAAGDQKAALKIANEALVHHRFLNDGDPDNLQLRRNLQLSLNGIAITHWIAEDLEPALKYFTESSQLAAQTIDDLVEPTLQSYKDLGEICYYCAQIAEQAKRNQDALKWYRKALAVALAARELELVGDEAETESIQPLRKIIADLESKSTKENE